MTLCSQLFALPFFWTESKHKGSSCVSPGLWFPDSSCCSSSAEVDKVRELVPADQICAVQVQVKHSWWSHVQLQEHDILRLSNHTINLLRVWMTFSGVYQMASQECFQVHKVFHLKIRPPNTCWFAPWIFCVVLVLLRMNMMCLWCTGYPLRTK